MMKNIISYTNNNNDNEKTLVVFLRPEIKKETSKVTHSI